MLLCDGCVDLYVMWSVSLGVLALWFEVNVLRFYLLRV